VFGDCLVNLLRRQAKEMVVKCAEKKKCARTNLIQFVDPDGNVCNAAKRLTLDNINSFARNVVQAKAMSSAARCGPSNFK
jgi:hypothetical protein